MPSPNNVHVNQALTDIALGYSNAEYIRTKMLPRIPVDKWHDTYWTHARKDVITPYDDLVGHGRANRVNYEPSTATFTCVDRGLEIQIFKKELSNADEALEIQKNRLSHVLNALELAAEIRAADLLNTAGSYATANQVTATAAWSDEDNANIILDMQAARSALAPGGLEESEVRCCMTLDLWHEAQRHPQLTGLLGANSEGLVSEAAFAAFFKIDQLFITEAQKNTANRGVATPTIARIWDTDKVCMVRVPKTGRPTKRTMMFAGIFTVEFGGSATTDMADDGVVEHTLISEWDEPGEGPAGGSLMTKLDRAEVEAVLMGDMGAVILSC